MQQCSKGERFSGLDPIRCLMSWLYQVIIIFHVSQLLDLIPLFRRFLEALWNCPHCISNNCFNFYLFHLLNPFDFKLQVEIICAFFFFFFNTKINGTRSVKSWLILFFCQSQLYLSYYALIVYLYVSINPTIFCTLLTQLFSLAYMYTIFMLFEICSFYKFFNG